MGCGRHNFTKDLCQETDQLLEGGGWYFREVVSAIHSFLLLLSKDTLSESFEGGSRFFSRGS
jgi:hypothetical protein